MFCLRDYIFLPAWIDAPMIPTIHIIQKGCNSHPLDFNSFSCRISLLNKPPPAHQIYKTVQRLIIIHPPSRGSDCIRFTFRETSRIITAWVQHLCGCMVNTYYVGSTPGYADTSLHSVCYENMLSFCRIFAFSNISKKSNYLSLRQVLSFVSMATFN